MNKVIEELLQPLPGEQPCGPDLSVDPQFDELETILKGKPEVDIGTIKKPAEPPEWRELKDKSADFLRKSKDLRVAMMFTCSLLQTGGVEGFRDGLQFIRGLLKQFWASLHPLLDPEDNNDPTQRLNSLEGLIKPRGSVLTGWMTIHDYLYTAPLCQPKGAAPVTFDQLQAAKLKQAGGEGAAPEAPSLSALAGALRAGAEQVTVRYQVLQETLEAVQGIDQFLTSTLSAGKTMSFRRTHQAFEGHAGGAQTLPSGCRGRSRRCRRDGRRWRCRWRVLRNRISRHRHQRLHPFPRRRGPRP